jgi:hypothetical protein
MVELVEASNGAEQMTQAVENHQVNGKREDVSQGKPKLSRADFEKLLPAAKFYGVSKGKMVTVRSKKWISILTQYKPIGPGIAQRCKAADLDLSEDFDLNLLKLRYRPLFNIIGLDSDSEFCEKLAALLTLGPIVAEENEYDDLIKGRGRKAEEVERKPRVVKEGKVRIPLTLLAELLGKGSCWCASKSRLAQHLNTCGLKIYFDSKIRPSSNGIAARFEPVSDVHENGELEFHETDKWNSLLCECPASLFFRRHFKLTGTAING